tara:strand:- start:344 stop:736 length:393 start_codon:yes stop_codon:yes gene_type:complete
MSLTFDSRSIKRVVLLDHLDALSPPEVQLLREELITAIDSMESNMGNIAYEKHLSGNTGDRDWQIRIRRKQEVCRVFLDKIKTVFDSNGQNLFRETFNKHFRWLLLEVISEEKYDQIKQKAKELALEELL